MPARASAYLDRLIHELIAAEVPALTHIHTGTHAHTSTDAQAAARNVNYERAVAYLRARFTDDGTYMHGNAFPDARQDVVAREITRAAEKLRVNGCVDDAHTLLRIWEDGVRLPEYGGAEPAQAQARPRDYRERRHADEARIRSFVKYAACVLELAGDYAGHTHGSDTHTHEGASEHVLAKDSRPVLDGKPVLQDAQRSGRASDASDEDVLLLWRADSGSREDNDDELRAWMYERVCDDEDTPSDSDEELEGAGRKTATRSRSPHSLERPTSPLSTAATDAIGAPEAPDAPAALPPPSPLQQEADTISQFREDALVEHFLLAGADATRIDSKVNRNVTIPTPAPPVPSWWETYTGACATLPTIFDDISDFARHAAAAAETHTSMLLHMHRALASWLDHMNTNLLPIDSFVARTLIAASREALLHRNHTVSPPTATAGFHNRWSHVSPASAHGKSILAIVLSVCAREQPVAFLALAIAREVLEAAPLRCMAQTDMRSIPSRLLGLAGECHRWIEEVRELSWLAHAYAKAVPVSDTLANAFHNVLAYFQGDALPRTTQAPGQPAVFGAAAAHAAHIVQDWLNDMHAGVEAYRHSEARATTLLDLLSWLRPRCTAARDVKTVLRFGWEALLTPSHESTATTSTWSITLLGRMCSDGRDAGLPATARDCIAAVDECQQRLQRNVVNSLGAETALSAFDQLASTHTIAFNLAGLAWAPAAVADSLISATASALEMRWACRGAPFIGPTLFDTQFAMDVVAGAHESWSASDVCWRVLLAALRAWLRDADEHMLVTDNLVALHRQTGRLNRRHDTATFAAPALSIPETGCGTAALGSRALPVHSGEFSVACVTSVAEWWSSALLHCADSAAQCRRRLIGTRGLDALHRIGASETAATPGGIQTLPSASRPLAPMALLGLAGQRHSMDACIHSPGRDEPRVPILATPVLRCNASDLMALDGVVSRSGWMQHARSARHRSAPNALSRILELRALHELYLLLCAEAGVHHGEAWSPFAVAPRTTPTALAMLHAPDLIDAKCTGAVTLAALRAIIVTEAERALAAEPTTTRHTMPTEQSSPQQPTSLQSLITPPRPAKTLGEGAKLDRESHDHVERASAMTLSHMGGPSDADSGQPASSAKSVFGRGLQPLPGVKPSAWWSIDAQVDIAAQKEREKAERQRQKDLQSVSAPTMAASDATDISSGTSVSSAAWSSGNSSRVPVGSGLSRVRRQMPGRRQGRRGGNIVLAPSLDIIPEDALEDGESDQYDGDESVSEEDEESVASSLTAEQDAAGRGTPAAGRSVIGTQASNQASVSSHSESSETSLDVDAPLTAAPQQTAGNDHVADPSASPGPNDAQDAPTAAGLDHAVAESSASVALEDSVAGAASPSKAHVLAVPPSPASKDDPSETVGQEHTAAAAALLGAPHDATRPLAHALLAWEQLKCGSDTTFATMVSAVLAKPLPARADNDAKDASIKAAPETNTLITPADIINAAVVDPLEQCWMRQRRAIVEVLLGPCALLDILWGLRAVYAFEQGNIMSGFTCRIFECIRQAPSRNNLHDSFGLTRWLQTALRTPGPHLTGHHGTDVTHEAYAGKLDPSLFAVRLAAVEPGNLEQMLTAGIRVQARIPEAVLRAAFPDGSLRVYERIFGFLLRIKRAVAELDAITHESADAETHIFRGLHPLIVAMQNSRRRKATLTIEQAAVVDAMRSTRAHLHTIQCHRRIMLHFTHVLHDTTLHGVLSEPWRTLVRTLRQKSCRSHEDVQLAHATYLRSMARRCMLDADQRHSQAAMGKLLARVEAFVADARSYYDAARGAADTCWHAFNDAAAAHLLLRRFDDTSPQKQADSGSKTDDMQSVGEDDASDSRSIAASTYTMRTGITTRSRLGLRTRYVSHARRARPAMEVIGTHAADVLQAALAPLRRHYQGVNASASAFTSSVAALVRSLRDVASGPAAEVAAQLDFNGFFARRAAGGPAAAASTGQ